MTAPLWLVELRPRPRAAAGVTTLQATQVTAQANGAVHPRSPPHGQHLKKKRTQNRNLRLFRLGSETYPAKEGVVLGSLGL